jgi:15-cis-phytoene synthase
MKSIFDEVSIKASKMVTRRYSTSFSLGINFLQKDLHSPIYSIYGFVRFADEIVDSFHDYDKLNLLKEFRDETFLAIERKISLNPILNSFQWAVNKYNIDYHLVDTFLKSMEMDLNKSSYSAETYKEYILGSAEVVGLMCLKVFVNADEKLYVHLTPYAQALGSAFQKINFLRDLKADFEGLGRTYFPNVSFDHFNQQTKFEIEKDIVIDFDKGLEGIKMLPKKARFGVYVAYIYYRSLLNKIRTTPANAIMEQRIRIPTTQKMALFATSYVRVRLNML